MRPNASDRAADELSLNMDTLTSGDQAPTAIDASGVAEKVHPSPPIERFFDIRIDREGIWHHQQRPIARMPLVKLFASVLRKESDGGYWLVTPVERGRIDVDDVPFVIVELRVDGAGCGQMINVRNNLDEWVTLGPDHPLHIKRPTFLPQTAPPVPYVDIRSGLEGRLLRSVYYDLIDLCEPHKKDGATRYGVRSKGELFFLDEHPD